MLYANAASSYLVLLLRSAQLADGERVVLLAHAEHPAEFEHRGVHFATVEVDHYVVDLAGLFAPSLSSLLNVSWLA